MKLDINRKDLLTALTLTAKWLSGEKCNIPQHADFIFNIEPGVLRVIGIKDIEYISCISVEVDTKESSTFSVPKSIKDTLAKSESLTMSMDIKCGILEKKSELVINDGKQRVTFKIAAYDGDNWKNIMIGDNVMTIKPDTLKSAVSKVSNACLVGKGLEARPALGKIHVEWDPKGEEFAFVATNGSLMSITHAEGKVSDSPFAMDLPTAFVNNVIDLAKNYGSEEVQMAESDKWLYAGGGDWVFAKIPDGAGQFPEWKRVASDVRKGTVSMQTNDFIRAINLSLAIVKQGNNIIKISVDDDQLVVSGESDCGSCKNAINSKGDNELTPSFNADMMKSIATAIEKDSPVLSMSQCSEMTYVFEAPNKGSTHFLAKYTYVS